MCSYWIYVHFFYNLHILCTYLCFTHSPQVILGVTNPFFAKALEHWPHIIRLADITNSSEEAYSSSSTGSGRSRSPGDGSDTKPGIQTKYKPFLNKDKAFARVISTSKVRKIHCSLNKYYYYIARIFQGRKL